MSEPIPESIPTSADPRSKRPLKKRALSPKSETATHITKLFANPDQPIHIPSGGGGSKPGPGAPDIVQNVQGSSAGAGSGEFHVYKASRRREYERLRGMEEEVEKEEMNEKWAREKAEREERDREKTRKNRERRNRGKKGAKKGDEVKEGELKPRVEVREGLQGLGGEGTAENGGEGNSVPVVQEEVGVIIHDDD